MIVILMSSSMLPSFNLQNQSPLVNNKNYTSCIKIAGISILPPLVTDENRKLLQEYKAKAVKLEQKIKFNLERQQSQQQNQRKSSNSNTDVNTSSDSSGIFSKSVDSSHRDNNQRSKATVSPYRSDHYETSSTGYDIRNLSTTESSPDNYIAIKLSPDHCNNHFNKSYEESKKTADYSDEHITENINSSSSTVYDNEGGVDYEDDSSLFQNSSTMSASENSILQMLPESNKDSNSGRNVTEVLGVNQQNLNLSPCKDLVLKSDVLNAISSKITIRGEKRDLNLSKEFYSFGNTIEKTKNDDSVLKIEHVDSVKNVINCVPEKSEKCVGDDDKESIIKITPKLKRQNSYTLDSPSPELLAFVERQQKKELNRKPGLLKRTHTWTVTSDEDEGKKSSTDFKPFKNNKDNNNKKSRKFWNVEEAKQQWNKQKKYVHSEMLKVNNINHNKIKDRILKSEQVQRSYKIPTKTKIEARSADCVYSLISSSRKSNKQIKYSENKIHSPPVSLKSCNGTNFDYNFRNSGNEYEPSVMSDSGIRDDALSTMTLTPEKDEKEIKYDATNHDVPYSACSSVSGDYSLINPSLKNSVNGDSTSVGSTISLNRYMSALSSIDKVLSSDDQTASVYNELMSQHTKQIEELVRRQAEELQKLLISSSRPASSVSFHRASPPLICSSTYTYNSPQIKNLSTCRTRLSTELASAEARKCSRKLTFNNVKYEKCPLDYTEEERKAAVIITAYAKGFLVRRLFKTEKVQQIIKSITDSLMCASNFDYSNRSNWTQGDVDLYERLLVQIEAALFSFHEVLFELPVNQKMAIIRADRERKSARKVQLNPPVISAATQRVIMRKKMQPQTIAKSNPSQKLPMKIPRQRRKSFTGFSCTSNSSRNLQQLQSASIQKSASAVISSRQPWK